MFHHMRYPENLYSWPYFFEIPSVVMMKLVTVSMQELPILLLDYFYMVLRTER